MSASLLIDCESYSRINEVKFHSHCSLSLLLIVICFVVFDTYITGWSFCACSHLSPLRATLFTPFLSAFPTFSLSSIPLFLWRWPSARPCPAAGGPGKEGRRNRGRRVRSPWPSRSLHNHIIPRTVDMHPAHKKSAPLRAGPISTGDDIGKLQTRNHTTDTEHQYYAHMISASCTHPGKQIISCVSTQHSALILSAPRTYDEGTLHTWFQHHADMRACTMYVDLSTRHTRSISSCTHNISIQHPARIISAPWGLHT
jgi:hypothetical protein